MNKYLLFKALCHLPKAIYFNFHYLPFHQAIKMPILFLSKVKLAHTQGTVQLFGRVRPGMVFIGGNGNVLYQQATNCCVWANYGGKCIFGSKISFCDGVALEIGQHGTLTFNDNIYLGPMVRIACYDSVIIGANSRIAWESIILDTDFHSTIDKATGEHSAITKPIVIGKNNWIGIRCLVMKGTQTPDFCIASAYSLLNKKYDVPNYSLIGGIPAKFLKEGLYRDLHSHVNDIQQEHYAKSIHSSEKKAKS